MSMTPLRDTALRNQLAHRVRILRRWPAGGHRAARELVPRKLALVRVAEGSLEHLVRSVVEGFLSERNERRDAGDTSFVEVTEASADGDASHRGSTWDSLSVLLARSEALGLNLDRVTVHQETHKVPYEDWDEDVLIACDAVPQDDASYAQAVETVWHDYQQSLLAQQQERDDYATYVRLQARFGHLSEAPR